MAENKLFRNLIMLFYVRDLGVIECVDAQASLAGDSRSDPRMQPAFTQCRVDVGLTSAQHQPDTG